MRLASKPYRELVEGPGASMGGEVTRFLRRNTPATSLWYTRLAVDRMVWDQIQTHLDPEYRQSFARVERRAKQDFGQKFWWAPGKPAPAF